MKKAFLSSSPRASVLVFSLVILTFLLVSALSLAAIAGKETRTSLSVDRSSIAFQVADAGAEEVLEQIYSGDYDLCPVSPSDCELDNLGSCDDGVISGAIGSGNYRVAFFEEDGDQLTDCSDEDWRTELDSIKSYGTHGNTLRSIQVQVRLPEAP